MGTVEVVGASLVEGARLEVVEDPPPECDGTFGFEVEEAVSRLAVREVVGARLVEEVELFCDVELLGARVAAGASVQAAVPSATAASTASP